jgi:hypothetical protein
MVLDDKVFEPKRAKNAGRPTWLPEPRTSQYYQELGLDYYEDPREIVNRKNLQKCSYEYERAIKTIYRIRTNDKREWITWYEARTGKTQLGSPIKAWVVYCGLNWRPIPTYEVKFDNETQQQTKKVSGIVERKKEYAIEYNAVNIDDLLIEANEFECQYIIMHDERDKFIVDNLVNFKGDFETLYKAMFQRKIEVANSNVNERRR